MAAFMQAWNGPNCALGSINNPPEEILFDIVNYLIMDLTTAALPTNTEDSSTLNPLYNLHMASRRMYDYFKPFVYSLLSGVLGYRTSGLILTATNRAAPGAPETILNAARVCARKISKKDRKTLHSSFCAAPGALDTNLNVSRARTSLSSTSTMTGSALRWRVEQAKARSKVWWARHTHHIFDLIEEKKKERKEKKAEKEKKAAAAAPRCVRKEDISAPVKAENSLGWD
ncbi:uncharacterized protein BDZ99DRAFT_514183 [Mytilinidion resinicola]|uniref:Uncharacterized protein n=1 Tax=Mytilinidion resinicola TaxID=574789 RepID=A0A6A6ZA15_9PEZI|nr:uncharacterized protein BDZ99DRAFT_514183 [Mytilinidion resinicola]KAF2817961.1 hypothetical protein BDZ99DRAFT_514183 [Mytilinidion resinicola]